ncbi:HAD hydrolase-like protein [Brucepastera parasyntrophica]|nr:HAD hydrolase-like protein [Brucepastera parasyntrophica]
MEHFEILKYFDGVTGAILTVQEAKRRCYQLCVKYLYTFKTETVMVGDRKYDIIGARENV